MNPPHCARCGIQVNLGMTIIDIYTIEVINSLVPAIRRILCEDCNQELKVWFMGELQKVESK